MINNNPLAQHTIEGKGQPIYVLLFIEVNDHPAI